MKSQPVPNSVWVFVFFSAFNLATGVYFEFGPMIASGLLLTLGWMSRLED